MRHRSLSHRLRRWLLLPVVALLVSLLLLLQFTVPGGLAGATTMWRSMSGALLITEPLDTTTASLVTPGNIQLQLYAENLVMPRFMQVADNGDLLVSRPTEGDIIALRDSDNDGRADQQRTLLTALDTPQGLVLHSGALYFSEATRISRVALDSAANIDGPATAIAEQLPAGSPFWSHNTKPLGLAPDGRLYYSIGSPCNACLPEDPRFSTIESINRDGSDRQTLASGLRNSIGMDWTPWSGQLYATENSRDLLGDDRPNDELNLIEPGRFYGWPYFYHDRSAQPATVRDRAHAAADISQLPAATPPAHAFNAHNAPLGIHFLRHPKWAANGYLRTAVVALHGSWNRSQLDGYKVVALQWDANGQIGQRDFVSGFLTEQGILGRPTAFTEDRDGNLYLSDDAGGRIYKLSLAE